jgi:hypothetical protein
MTEATRPTAATVSATATVVAPATAPHSRLPPAIEPMNAVMKTARPRERTQFGSAICAATWSDESIDIQATPLTAIARPSGTMLSNSASAAIAAA